ncbi:nucleoside deaminase [Halobacteriales archaeon SW_7_68_16]|nr:MAG: nucleoside deaminase [Halobacteriales archaeon SW_7_68_16]
MGVRRPGPDPGVLPRALLPFVWEHGSSRGGYWRAHPAFVDAHTHVGDSVAKDAAVGVGLERAVVPPDSLKHRQLRAASREESVAAMRDTMRFMRATGTAAFLDFREFGRRGAALLREAAADRPVEAIVFGSDEPAVLEIADGYGASGATDRDFTVERAATREAGKPFAIHAGEPDATDIHPALDLEPDLLVHMVHATDEHLSRVEKRGVPVVACPRVNATLGVGRAPLRSLLAATTVALGTDNAMLNEPSMYREMAHTVREFDVTPREVLGMATRAGAEIADLNCGVIEPGRDAALVVLDGDSPNLSGTADPLASVVRRAGVGDVECVLL